MSSTSTSPPRMIFTVTVYHQGRQRQRTWGWFDTPEEAEAAILKNEGDLFEARWYDLAVVEMIAPGICGPIEEVAWYQARYRLGSHDPTVVRIPKPAELDKLDHFAMG